MVFNATFNNISVISQWLNCKNAIFECKKGKSDYQNNAVKYFFRNHRKVN